MIKKSLVLWCCFYFCIKTICGLGQLKGEECSAYTYQPGVCTAVEACPSVLSDLRRGIQNRTICGYEGRVEVVCCPSAEATIEDPETITAERISVRKCNEYKGSAYNTIKVSLGQTKVSNCAVTSIPLIAGERFEAKIREFPHVALIGYEDGDKIEWDCGGSLISDQFVLTAAHCIEAHFGPAKYVRLGEHDLNRTDDTSHVDLSIIESIAHPKFRYRIAYNDIGLLKLERKVQFNGAIRPACLPQQSAVPTRTVIASGWGTEKWRGERNSVLQKLILDIVSQEECNASFVTSQYLNRGIMTETQVCAGSKETYNGEGSGSSLQIYHETNFCSYTLVGISSFGSPVSVSTVYTRVYAYLNWIEAIVWPVN